MRDLAKHPRISAFYMSQMGLALPYFKMRTLKHLQQLSSSCTQKKHAFFNMISACNIELVMRCRELGLWGECSQILQVASAGDPTIGGTCSSTANSDTESRIQGKDPWSPHNLSALEHLLFIGLQIVLYLMSNARCCSRSAKLTLLCHIHMR